MSSKPLPTEVAPESQPIVLRLSCPRDAFCPRCGDRVNPEAFFIRFNTVFCGRCGIQRLAEHQQCFRAMYYPTMVQHMSVSHGVMMLAPFREDLRRRSIWQVLQVVDPANAIPFGNDPVSDQ